MRIAVIEDEKPHRDLLVRYLEDWRSTQKESIILEAFNSSEAFWFRYEENREYDILFIDIQMPGMSGMELARKVRSGDGDIVLVFVTGIGDYLEEGYEVEALHYLRKPLSREKLEKCLEKALQRRKKGVFVTVHTGEEILKISQECVNYVEARGRNCCIGRVREPEELAVKESFSEMENMMYKIEGEDLYLIGTSEHSMIGRFADTILSEDKLPQTLTSYSPCFRKEVGAHGIEERGVYRIHQSEKQEMIVICKPEESADWFVKLYNNTVDFFRSLDIPVRTLECCSGDLADLKVKSLDVEAWSPRQQKYFEVGSCSNLGDAQARRLGIRIKGDEGNYFAHTLNNTVVAPPRMLIAFLENNLNQDGSINIPTPLRMYMGGKALIK